MDIKRYGEALLVVFLGGLISLIVVASHVFLAVADGKRLDTKFVVGCLALTAVMVLALVVSYAMFGPYATLVYIFFVVLYSAYIMIQSIQDE